jgi:hypothetical protein
MTPTHLLLLRLARLALTDEDRLFVENHARAVDWSEVFRLAQRGGIAGLVARHLAGLPVPLEVRHSFLAMALQTRAQNTVMMDEARRLCGAAEAQGLMLVPLKGAALNSGLPYDDLSLRAMCDLDLLTRRGQMNQVERLMRQEGYEGFGDRTYYLRYSHHLHYRRPLGGDRFIYLELHWTALRAAFGRPAYDEALLQRSVVRRHQGVAFRALHPDDLMLTLLLHLADHRFRAQLKWGVDLAEVARVYEGILDWLAIFDQARMLGASRVVSYAAALVQELFQGPLPRIESRSLAGAPARTISTRGSGGEPLRAARPRAAALQSADAQL